MPRLVMTVAHELGKAEAERRLKEKLNAVRTRYGGQVSDLREAWSEHTLSFGFKVIGMKVAGTLVVEDTEVRVAGRAPFAIAILKRLIERRIREELGGLLS